MSRNLRRTAASRRKERPRVAAELGPPGQRSGQPGTLSQAIRASALSPTTKSAFWHP